MKQQHNATSMLDRTPRLTARRRGRLQLALLALACVLFGTACATSTLVTQVVHKEGGQNLIGQSMTIEFNQGVWNALQDDDRSQLGVLFDSYKDKGWTVTKQDGGRIQTVSFDPATFADLQAKGWTVSVNAKSTGNITTAKWSPSDNNSGGSSSGSSGGGSSQQIVVTIDESDPQTTHYKYQAAVVVQYQDSSGDTTETTGPGDTSGDGSPFGYIMAQAMATAEADPRYANLQQAVKDAGPPKMIVTVSLPGTIETTTINGSQGGTTSGNQVTWNMTMDQNATYNLEADSSLSGGGGGSGGDSAFGVSVSCNPDFPGDTGQIVCVANSANKPDGAEIEYEWKFDGRVQEAKGNILELHGIAKGEHSVSAVAIATNQNNLRSQPGGATFTKNTGADTAIPTTTTTTSTTSTTTSGDFTVSVSCSVSDKTITCLASPNGAPADANLTYAWTSNGSAVAATGASATIAASDEGFYQVIVKVTDTKSGKSSTASTATAVGSVADPVGTIWEKIPDDWKVKINAGLTGSGGITPPKPGDISTGAVLGTLGSLAAAGASAAAAAGAATLGLGGAGPAGAPAVPGVPGTPPNQPGQNGSSTDNTKDDNQKGNKRGDFCMNERAAMQSASSQARGLQNQLQVQRSQMNALQLQYEQTRKSMVATGIVGIAAIPTAIWAGLSGAVGSAAGWTGVATGGGTFSEVSSSKLADIRNQINGTQQYISDLEGQFDGALQAMQNAKSALDSCTVLHPGGDI